MTHPHDHDHDHDHHHPHDPSEPGQGPELTVQEKFYKILTHWRKHNAEHADTYRQWALKARENAMADIGDLLDQAADLTQKIDPLLEQARQRLS